MRARVCVCRSQDLFQVKAHLQTRLGSCRHIFSTVWQRFSREILASSSSISRYVLKPSNLCRFKTYLLHTVNLACCLHLVPFLIAFPVFFGITGLLQMQQAVEEKAAVSAQLRAVSQTLRENQLSLSDLQNRYYWIANQQQIQHSSSQVYSIFMHVYVLT